MAERQTVFRWLRQNLAALIAGITLTAITVGTIDASTITVDAIVAGDASLGISGTEIATTATTGGAVTANAAGVTIAAASAGDDVSITSVDELTATVTDGGVVQCLTGGVEVLADSAADDVVVRAADDVNITATGDDVNISAAAGSVALSGAYVTHTTTADVTITGGVDVSIQAGNLLALTAPGAGDDIWIDAADDAWIEGGSARLTLDDTSGAVFTAPVTAPIVASGTAYRLPRVIEFDYVNSAPSTTAEEPLATVTLPANTLSATGMGVRIAAQGYATANANNKTVRIRVGASGSGTGGTAVVACNFNTGTDGYWFVDADWYRTGASSQKVSYKCTGSDGSTTAGLRFVSGSAAGSASAANDAAIIDMNLTIQNATTASDLKLNFVRWEWL